VTQFRLRMAVTLKPEVLDPAGQATQQVVHERGFPEVSELRIGKVVDIAMNANSAEDALAKARRLGSEFLANPVLERFEVWVQSDET